VFGTLVLRLIHSAPGLAPKLQSREVADAGWFEP